MSTMTPDKPAPTTASQAAAAPPEPAAPLDYATPGRDGMRPSALFPVLVILLLVAVTVALLAAFFGPSCCRAREPANRVKCTANLRTIGQAIRMYADDHGGRLPDSLEQMFLAMPGVMSSETLVCPSSQDERATGTTPETLRAQLTNPGPVVRHVSYVYLGKGMTLESAGPDVVLAHDRPGNHNRHGINVLYGDGRVEVTGRDEAERLLAELEAGHDPPRGIGAGE